MPLIPREPHRLIALIPQDSLSEAHLKDHQNPPVAFHRVFGSYSQNKSRIGYASAKPEISAGRGLAKNAGS